MLNWHNIYWHFFADRIQFNWIHRDKWDTTTWLLYKTFRFLSWHLFWARPDNCNIWNKRTGTFIFRETRVFSPRWQVMYIFSFLSHLDFKQKHRTTHPSTHPSFISIYNVQCSLLHFKLNIWSLIKKFTRNPFVKILVGSSVTEIDHIWINFNNPVHSWT